MTADCLARLGDLDSAVSSAEDSLLIIQETSTYGFPRIQGISAYTTSVKYLLSLLYLALKKPAKAAFLLEDLSIARDVGTLDRLGVRVHLGQAFMVRIIQALGRFSEAGKVLEDAVREIPDSQVTRRVHALSQLGLCCLCQNQHDSALETLQECESLLRMHPQLPVHPRRKYRVYTTLGNILASTGNLSDASSCLKSAISLLETLGETHSIEMAKVHISLGTVYSGLQRYNEALRALTLARDIYERIQGPKTPEIVPILTQISGVLMEQGDLDSAMRYLSLAFDSEKRSQGEYTDYGLNIWFRIINLHLEANHTEEVIKQVTSLDEQKGRFSKLGQAMIYNEIGNVLRHAGDPSGALDRYLKALCDIDREVYETITEAGSMECARMHLHIGSLYLTLGRLSDGSAHLLYAKKAMERVYGELHMELEPVYLELSKLYRLQGRSHEADFYSSKARKIAHMSYDGAKP